VIILNLAVWITGGLIIFSKFMDCWTTSKYINPRHPEMNPIANFVFKKIGIQNGIWAIFAVVIFVVVIAITLLFCCYNNNYYKLTFIGAGLIVTTVQFAAAHSNIPGKENPIANWIARLFR
jgi:energy-converting hydrogenase Eha subunit E